MDAQTHGKRRTISRRGFLTSAAAAGAAAALPAVLPASVFGAAAPSHQIAMGSIGVGRMGKWDMETLMTFEQVRMVAVSDVDSFRLNRAKAFVEARYARAGSTGFRCKGHADFRELTDRRDIDAVMIATPDHWHALMALAAVRTGKDVFLQKPLSLTIEEGRALSDAAQRAGTIFQVGSQQRSENRFRFACELVRNGRIGKLHTVKVGFGTDPGTRPQPVMPVPGELNYNMWLGQAPDAPYTVSRVHPRKSFGRPGWLRISDYGAGMITGWGSHHMDIAHWGMGGEAGGPIDIQGEATFPTDGLWDVHGAFSIEYTYPNAVKLFCTDTRKNRQGVRFEGTDGWVYVRRGFIDAEPKSLLKSVIGPEEVHLYRSTEHKRNWVECMLSRRETVAPIENGHRSCTACLLGEIAMRTGRKLKWDAKAERFTNDAGANSMLSRAMRPPWHL